MSVNDTVYTLSMALEAKKQEYEILLAKFQKLATNYRELKAKLANLEKPKPKPVRKKSEPEPTEESDSGSTD